jgi:GAF domain-containing protein
MSRDAGSRLPDPPAVDYALPKVVNIEIRATTFKAPRHRNFKSALKNSNDAVEFIELDLLSRERVADAQLVVSGRRTLAQRGEDEPCPSGARGRVAVGSWRRALQNGRDAERRWLPGCRDAVPGRPLTIRTRETLRMRCPRCQHENRPQAKLCEECGNPFTAMPSGPPAPSYAEITSALSEALAQQTATAEILRVIASSPSDVRPVFDTILDNATRLCEAHRGGLFLFDGEAYHAAAFRGAASALVEHATRAPIRPGPHTALARVLRELRPIHIDDLLADAAFAEGDPVRRAVVELEGMRTLLMVPLLKEGQLIGAIDVHRREVRPFTDRQIGLLQTFAAQAVIAIENVRLFTELQEKNRAVTEAHAQVTEALDQQTATSEILRVIASSPTDLQPVMEAIAENAARVCGAADVSIFRLEGEPLRLVARHGQLRRALAIGDSIPASRDSVSGRPVCDRRTIHVEDILAAEAEFPATVPRMRQAGSPTRTLLATPLLREGTPLGVIVISRGPEVHPFSATQIALLETFAAQAVIAIENVRLFNETKEALEQQTATADILRVISSSPTDVQPVFDTIVRDAARLCDATRSNLFRFEGELLAIAATFGFTPADVESSRKLFPRQPGREFAAGRAVLEGRVIHIPDVTQDPEYRNPVQSILHLRTVLAVPMLREGIPIGALVIWRSELRPFSEAQIKLVTTFADQAVIAIENRRLFNETQEALERQTATSEILRVIASSPTDVQPVFAAVLRSAARLCEALDASILQVDGDQLRLVAHEGPIPTIPLGEFPLRGTSVGRAVLDRRTIHVADLQAEVDDYPEASAFARSLGYRTTLSVPLLRGTEAIGAIGIRRTEVRPF